MAGVESVDVAIIGGGQGGLSLSHELVHSGVEHVVLERGKVGQSWRDRWDSFTLVIPNWTVQLPGGTYRGSDPDGFMPREGIVQHLVDYAAAFGAPVREGVSVTALDRLDSGAFRLRTSDGDLQARRVVLASGGYQRPHRPSCGTPPGSVFALNATDYRNPEALPPGDVLIVGSGQTGCQLAEELIDAGRRTVLACGRAPWIPRRIEGRDTVSWLVETPFMDGTLRDLPSPAARLIGNPQASGRDGGHDLHYRTLQAHGVTLAGRLVGFDEEVARFGDDLAESVAFGDSRYEQLCQLIHASCVERGITPPEMAPPPPFVADAPREMSLEGFGAIIFTSGYRPDYTSWVHMPAAFDDMGFPIQTDGSSTAVPGLHFMGVHYQRKRKSATLLGVGEDAAVLAETLTSGRGA